ncbi:MAG TPA: TonB-dependent receptor, partial [Chryseosolibacter sp.]|nr:TonB-dependent receptor [Chryseosolibacter sp.]
DGIPSNDNMYGTAFTWEITPLVFTRSMEVIRGPGSALYGSNAMNGVISYNTLSAKDLTRKVELRTRIGNNHSRIFDILTGHETESVSFVSAFNLFESDGNQFTSFDSRGTTQSFDISNKRSSYYFFNKIEAKGKLRGLSLQYHEQAWNFSTGHGWLFYVPDQPENMDENRRMIALRFKTPNQEKQVQQEYLVRYQRHGVDWNVRLFPKDTPGYPYGITEILKTHTSDVFSRAQFSYALGRNSVLLGGIENSVFKYGGDDLHLSNVNLHTDFSPTTNNEFVDVGDYFAWLGDNPFVNTGVFAQYSSPKLGERLTATVGLRYDYAFFRFNALDIGGEERRSYDKMSPRLSLVFAALDNLNIKLMAGRAFRTPAASELFGSNTFLLASNIRKLQPEVVTTFEVAADYTVSSNINWRINAYRTEFNDQIAYSVSNFNLSTNLYSLTSMGVENELAFKAGNFDGFTNYSYVRRLDEKIVDPTISLSKRALTWVPQHVVNVGLKYGTQAGYASLQGHYQGAVDRRLSDLDDAFDSARGNKVDSWLTFDFRLVYKVSDMLEVGIFGTNLTDSNGRLIKNNPYAFDYQIPGRAVMLDLRLML